MALNHQQQIFELIKKNKSILIIFKEDWTGDDLAGSLALASFLKKMDRQVEIVCQNFKPKTNLSFLSAGQIKDQLTSLRKFIIKINTQKTKVGEFYYDHDRDQLNIYLTPEAGQFHDDDVTTTASDYKHDLIFIINSPDLESLGEAYEQNTDFFYQTPKINLDYSSQNEYFGNIDLVNLTASSASEIIYELIEQIDPKLLDEEIATQLLAGIILATKNFKTDRVTPKTLQIASLLTANGGRREQIIQHLYQARFISTLKLWGRVLSRLNNDLNNQLIWSSLAAQDFLETATTPIELIDVIDELIVSMPKTEIIILIYEIKHEKENEIKAVIYSTKHIDSLMISRKFNPTGNKELAKISLKNISLAEAEKIIIEEIKKNLIRENNYF